MDTVDKWLKTLRLHKYTPLFKSLTYEQMLNLDEDYLIGKNVTKGARNKMLVSVKRLNLRTDRLLSMIDDLNQEEISMKEALTVLKDLLATPIPYPKASITNTTTTMTTDTNTNTRKTNTSTITSSTTKEKESSSSSSSSSIYSKLELTYLFVETLEKVAQRFMDNTCHGIMASIVDECLKHNSFTKEQKAKVASFKQHFTREQKAKAASFKQQLRQRPQSYNHHHYQYQQHQFNLHQFHLKSHYHYCHHHNHWNKPTQQPPSLSASLSTIGSASTSDEEEQQAYKEYSLLGPGMTFELPCLKAMAATEKHNRRQLCFFHTIKTKQFQLDDYMQMIYHQPTAYQHLLATYHHPPNSFLASNLIDSLDIDDQGGGSGHPDYTNHGRDQPQFTVPASFNNNSLALFRLLNIIDQSAPTFSMPFQNSKTSSPIWTNTRSSSATMNASNNNHKSNGHINNHNRHHHHQITSQFQTTPTNYINNNNINNINNNINNNNNNNWSRKRDHSHWRQQQRQHETQLEMKQPQSSVEISNKLKSAAPKALKSTSPANLNTPLISQSSTNTTEKLNGVLTSSTLLDSKVPHDADSEMIAANNAPRCDKFTPDICVDDFEYPEQAIIDEIQKKKDVFELMYSEVKDNEPLVDGIPRDVEESYNYDYYYYGKTNLTSAASQLIPQQIGAGLRLSPSAPIASNIDGMDMLIGAITSHASNSNPTSQSPPTTGFICPSEVMYGKPKLAKNKKGLWKVIVNAGEFTQTVRLEKCLLPNRRCNYVSAQSYESRCAQVHSYHRLLVFEKNRGFYIDTFRLPTGCNCHVTKKPLGGRAVSASAGRATQQQVEEQQQQHHNNNNNIGNNGASISGTDGGSSSSSSSNNSAEDQIGALDRPPTPPSHQNQRYASAMPGARLSSPRTKPSESMLSQTLWSILSGGGGGGAGSFAGAESAGEVRNSYYTNVGSSSNTKTINNNNMKEMNEAYQSQSAILDHLSQNPSLAANITDSVLRQLIDVAPPPPPSPQAHQHHHHNQQQQQQHHHHPPLNNHNPNLLSHYHAHTNPIYYSSPNRETAQ